MTLPPLPKPDICDPGRFGIGWNEASMQAYAASAVAAEREACARTCEQLAADAYACVNAERVLVCEEPVGRDCAAAIRARGE